MEVALRDHSVQVDREGAGPDLVLLHSLLTDPAAFDLVVATLARSHTVSRIWLPGFGRSTPLEDPTIDGLADRVAATMAAIGCAPGTTVLGNGLGAFVATALAIRHAPRLGRLILTNGGATFSEERRGAFATMSALVEQGGMAAVADVAVKRIFPADYLAAHPDVIESRRAVLERIDPDAFAGACRALGNVDLTPRLGDIEIPTLIIAGEADETTPLAMSEALAAAIPDSHLVILPGCGHCPQLQDPTALLDAITPFLAGAG